MQWWNSPCKGGNPRAKVSPVQCWDSLVLLGGLGSDPFKIIQAIYGSFQGDLALILDLGTQPVLDITTISTDMKS